MRIRQLDLRAFGHFTGRSIALNPGPAGLDLIYGPNEAGKSTMLRAVQALLFGIPSRTSDSFRHSYTDLRIGATLALADGSTLSVVRRKGNAKTLRDGRDDAVIDDARLAAVLGPLESESFRARFALDGEELSRGGRAIVGGEGDLGQALFAAAAGGRQLDTLRDRLQSDLEKLFSERAQKPAINANIRRHGELARDIRDKSLAPTVWQQARDELDRLESRRSVLTSDMVKREATLRRLQRIKDALPAIARRREADRERQSLQHVPLLPDDFPARRSSAMDTCEQLRQMCDQLQHDLEARTEQLQSLSVNPELLSHGAAIRSLRDDVKSIRELRRTSTTRTMSLAQLHRDADICLRNLRWSGSDGLPETMRPTDALIRRLDQLRKQHSQLQEKQSNVEKRARQQKGALEEARRGLNAAPTVPDYSELERAIELARELRPLTRQLDELRSAEKRETAQLEARRTVLPLWSGTVDQLRLLAVPLETTLERFERELSELDGELITAQGEARRLERNLAEVEQKLLNLSAGGEVPSVHSLTGTRQLRDRGWLFITQRLQSGSQVTDELASEEVAFLQQIRQLNGDSTSAMTTMKLPDLLSAFQALMRSADALGDQLRAEANRVAEAGTLRDLQRELTTLHNAARQTLERVETRRSALLEQWQQEWQPLGINPRMPREMREWSRRRTEVLEIAARVEKSQSDAAFLEQKMAEQTTALNRALALTGSHSAVPTSSQSDSGPDDDGSVAALFQRTLQRAEDELAELSERDQARHSLQQKLTAEDAAWKRLDEERAEVSREVRQWETVWQQTVVELGHDSGVDPEEAQERLQQIQRWFELQDRIIQAKNDERAALERIHEFEQDVRDLVQRLAVDLQSESDLTMALEELNARCDENQKRNQERDRLESECRRQADQLERRRNELAQKEAMLRQLCREACAESVEQLPQIEVDAMRKRQAEDRFRQASETLEEHSGGLSLDDFIAEAGQCSSDEWEIRLAQCRHELNEVRQQHEQLLIQCGQARQALESWDGDSEAAKASEEMQSVLATLRSDAEEFARLTVVSELLKRTGERYREKHQGPILSRAGQLFCDLTCGAFSGLQTDYDEKGTPIIVGLRSRGQGGDAAGAERVTVSGMSEGTCDQLYLALRLASLEEYLKQHEPVPLLIDDLLIRFDDQRSAAALRVLADLSRRTQVIVFTHHEHVLELARAAVPDELRHEHRLVS